MKKKLFTIVISVVCLMFLSACFISTDTIKYWNGPDMGETIQTAVCISIDDSVPTVPVIKIKEVVMFDWDSNDITPEGDVLLNKVAKIMKDNPEINLALTGYASVEGSTVYNQGLSQRRVDAVYVTLMQKGIKGNRMTTVAKGETDFFGDPLNANRRVMVLSVD